MTRARVAGERDGAYELREPEAPYNRISGHEKAALKSQNVHL